MTLRIDEPDNEPEVYSLPGLGEKCDHGCGREAVFRVLDYREREVSVTCEECVHYDLRSVQTADGRSWPF